MARYPPSQDTSQEVPLGVFAVDVELTAVIRARTQLIVDESILPVG